MTVLVCDDIPDEAEKLSDMLNNIGYRSLAFTRGADALEYIRSGAAADICIIDIIMPEMSGIELAQILRESGFGGEIIFLSTSNEYGPQAYEVKAFYYLVKPPSQSSIRRVLDEIKTKHDQSDRSGIKIKVSGSARFIRFRDVEYTEVVKNYVTIYLTTGETVEIRSTFAEIAPQLLCDSRFIQCHQSYVVNMDAVVIMTSREITMSGGARIPVSKSYPDTKMKYLRRGLRGERR